MFVNPTLQHSLLLFSRKTVQGRVQPLNHILVINTQIRRGQLHTLIFGLRHVIKTSVVHDRRRRSILLGKACRTQRVHGVSIRCGHVMHQPQRMPDLVSDNIRDRFVHHILRHLLRTHSRVYLSRMRETPVIDQLHDVIVHKHGSINNLSRCRVYPRGTHGIFRGSRHVTDT